jgi:hypothetical protein
MAFMGVLQDKDLRMKNQSKTKKITHLISCDIFAKNSLLLLFASSAASIAAVFFCILSRKLKNHLIDLRLSLAVQKY